MFSMTVMFLYQLRIYLKDRIKNKLKRYEIITSKKKH